MKFQAIIATKMWENENKLKNISEALTYWQAAGVERGVGLDPGVVGAPWNHDLFPAYPGGNKTQIMKLTRREHSSCALYLR